MRRHFITMALCAAACARGSEPSSNFERMVTERTGLVPGAVVSVYLEDLGDSSVIEINADSVFHAASTMKVPVMIEYFRQLDHGRFSRGQEIELQNRFRSIVDGSEYSLSADDDSDSTLYEPVGGSVPIRELVERMITRSSNLATNAVIELVGADSSQATARELGAADIMVRRGVEDSKAFEQGLNNTTTARDLGVLLRAIANGSAASDSSCREMLEILEQQEFNEEIPAGLPSGTRVAHKTGFIRGVLHDAAVVFPPGGRPPFVLVVLTRDIPDRAQARALIQDIARFSWEELGRG